MSDTSLEMKRFYRELLMQKSGEERFRMGVGLCSTAKRLVLSSFPDNISEVEKRIRLLYRYYADDFSQDELAKIAKWLHRFCFSQIPQI